MTTAAQKLETLFAEERRLNAHILRVERAIKDVAVQFWEEQGFTARPRREALERAVAVALADEVAQTPLERCIETGRAFE